MNESSRSKINPDSSCVCVREAAVTDADAIARIYNTQVDAGGSTFDTQHWNRAAVCDLLDFGEPDGWFVAEENGGVVGWASVRRYSLRIGYRFTCETAIYLSPIAFGKGIADELQQRVESHCCDHKMHHAVAKIIADNERSIAFHRRFGYELVGIQKEIGYMNGSWSDVAILQKIF
ncbi:MAG: N-acetyltransferase family protein [Rubripirellula sp.]